MGADQIASGFSDAEKSDALNNWLEFIEHEASVILVKTDNAAKAFKMFETLNDRGLKTSQADLVKSYLFGEAGHRVAEAQSRWSSMKSNLEEIADDDRAINFLRHSLIATKQFVRAEEIYSTIQKDIRGETASSSFLGSLESTSRIYVATFQPSSDFWSGYPASAVKDLEAFNLFDLRPIRPLVLSLAINFKTKEFSVAIKLLTSISVRLVIASRTRSGSLEQTFASAALGVTEKKILNTKNLRTALQNAIVSDADFDNEFRLARVSNAGLARYYLRSLEAAYAGESEPWYVVNEDPSVITLEHVMPQNPADGWTNDEEVRKANTKRLGNLCLLQKSGNEAIGNRTFKEKRIALKSSPYATTSMIGKKKDWSPVEIEARQSTLAKLALKAWPLA
jgi:hypothetical protein